MSLKHNLQYYSSLEQTRLNDDLHVLSNKSKFNMRYEATLIAKDFKDLHIKLFSAKAITPDHIQKLVSYYQEKKGYATSTIQSKITTLRHILHAANNSIKIPAFTLEKRDGLNTKNIDKSSYISDKIVNEIKDLAVKSAIKLAVAYGLRKEESIYAVHALSKNYDLAKAENLHLQGSWAKNGRARDIKMQDGGKILKEVKSEILSQKLNLKSTKIEQFRNKIDNYIKNINKSFNNAKQKIKFHGFRHAYAQDRYFALTGMAAPAKGGKKFSQMNKQEQALYMSASRTISRELGHNRADISRVYVGK